MIVGYIRHKVEPGQRNALVNAYAQAATQLQASPLCLAYELTECEEEEGQFTLCIEWTLTEAHLHGFTKSDLFSSFFATSKPYSGNIQEMRHYRPTGVIARKEW